MGAIRMGAGEMILLFRGLRFLPLVAPRQDDVQSDDDKHPARDYGDTWDLAWDQKVSEDGSSDRLSEYTC